MKRAMSIMETDILHLMKRVIVIMETDILHLMKRVMVIMETDILQTSTKMIWDVSFYMEQSDIELCVTERKF